MAKYGEYFLTQIVRIDPARRKCAFGGGLKRRGHRDQQVFGADVVVSDGCCYVLACFGEMHHGPSTRCGRLNGDEDFCCVDIVSGQNPPCNARTFLQRQNLPGTFPLAATVALDPFCLDWLCEPA